MRNDSLRDYQTLHRNWVVIKVAYGWVMIHAARHGWSRWDLPLHHGEIFSGPSRVIRFRKHGHATWVKCSPGSGICITVSRREVKLSQGWQVLALILTTYTVRQKECCIWHFVMVRLMTLRIYGSRHILLGTATDYRPDVIRDVSMCTWTYRVARLRGKEPIRMWSEWIMDGGPGLLQGLRPLHGRLYIKARANPEGV